MIRLLLVALVVGALVTGGIVANVVLLGYAESRHDPVGRLTPRAVVRQSAPSRSRIDVDERPRGDDDSQEAEEPDD